VLATVNFIAKGGVELTRGRARTAKDGRSGGWLAKGASDRKRPSAGLLASLTILAKFGYLFYDKE
jgi:hypothetical protein